MLQSLRICQSHETSHEMHWNHWNLVWGHCIWSGEGGSSILAPVKSTYGPALPLLVLRKQYETKAVEVLPGESSASGLPGKYRLGQVNLVTKHCARRPMTLHMSVSSNRTRKPTIEFKLIDCWNKEEPCLQLGSQHCQKQPDNQNTGTTGYRTVWLPQVARACKRHCCSLLFNS